MGDGDGGPVVTTHKETYMKDALFLAYIVQSFIDGSANLEEVHAAFIDVQQYPQEADTIVLAAEKALAAVKEVLTT